MKFRKLESIRSERFKTLPAEYSRRVVGGVRFDFTFDRCTGKIDRPDIIPLFA